MSACPICRKPPEAAYRPFCSRRCADVDLQRWLSDRYAVPGGEANDENTVPASPREDDE